jgi:hypothetical protein
MALVRSDLRGAIAACERVAASLYDLGWRFKEIGRIYGCDSSPYGFGTERLVGLGAVTQIGGELGTGVVVLLSNKNKYAAATLLRQIVEVEYLAWALANDETTATAWLHTNRDLRERFWSPAALRKRSGNRFAAEDYRRHCDFGGHPTREGANLLPAAAYAVLPMFLWADLTHHLMRIWTSAVQAANDLTPSDVPVLWDSCVSDELRALVQRWSSHECPISKWRAYVKALRDTGLDDLTRNYVPPTSGRP